MNIAGFLMSWLNIIAKISSIHNQHDEGFLKVKIFQKSK